MCESFKKGAESRDVEVEIVNLYDINYSGCRSCFACKLRNGKNFGRCAYPDELSPLLEKITSADGLVLASPIYFGEVSGQMRSFIERLMFPFFEYKEGYPSIAPKKLQTAVIYTMNVPEEICEETYADTFHRLEWFLGKLFTPPERICAFDTYQFDNYDKYVAELFDKDHKKRQHEEQFPQDLQNAYNHGVKMAEKILA